MTFLLFQIPVLKNIKLANSYLGEKVYFHFSLIKWAKFDFKYQVSFVYICILKQNGFWVQILNFRFWISSIINKDLICWKCMLWLLWTLHVGSLRRVNISWVILPLFFSLFIAIGIRTASMHYSPSSNDRNVEIIYLDRSGFAPVLCSK